jgi:hypothetical protein
MHLDAWLDQEDARMVDTIRRHGWMIHYIGGATCCRPGCHPEPSEGPPFAYTTGLFGMGHPELLIVGVDTETAALVLNTLGHRIRRGENLMPGMIYRCEGWDHPIVPETVPNAGDILLWSNSFYSRPTEHSVPALQLTYDDDAGRFPWDPSYAAPEGQPRPGTFSA